MNTIPISLQITLDRHFSGKSFTFFSVITHAKADEIDEWKAALKVMADAGDLVCVASRMLGDVFTLPDQGGVA